MYDHLRLTELHEEWATLAFAARELARSGELVRADRKHREVLALEKEIDARVARQEIGRWGAENPGLRFGVPDAVRTYRVPREAAP